MFSKGEKVIIRTEEIRQRVIDMVRDLPLDPAHQIEIKLFKRKRSLNQNALFHKWISLLADHTGYTDYEMKDVLKQMFMQPELKEVLGHMIASRHTSELDTKQMGELMTQIQAWALVDLDYKLPSAEDLGWR